MMSSLRQSLIILRNRVVSGLFVALPLVITAMVIKWIYDMLASMLIEPMARLVLNWWTKSKPVDLPDWVASFLAPIVAIISILAILFMLGMFFRSRVHRLVDWIVLQVPGGGPFIRRCSRSSMPFSGTSPSNNFSESCWWSSHIRA
ncbi:MAG: hypothetical protein R3B96_00615 [Pirellulaceae bacterium]